MPLMWDERAALESDRLEFKPLSSSMWHSCDLGQLPELLRASVS